MAKITEKKITKSQIEKLPDGTIKLTILIPWADLKPTWDTVVSAFADESKVPGFRKGKAPQKLVEDRINKSAIREEVLKIHLPKVYTQAVTEQNLKPIIDPRIHVHSTNGEGELAEGKDWVLEAQTAELPEVNLGDYKDKVKSITAKSKIIVPGKEAETPKFDEIVNALLNSADVKIPRIITERETDRLLAQSLDEIRRLGMNLDQYLASTGKTPEQFRMEYETRAEADLKLEFVLQKIAQEEKITVTDQDIQKTLDSAKSEAEKTDMEKNKYLIATILRQQKTLDFIRNL